MVLKLGLHTSDLAAMTKDATISSLWTDRVMDEFYAQGDRERALNLPISMLCDRKTVELASSQVSMTRVWKEKKKEKGFYIIKSPFLFPILMF